MKNFLVLVSLILWLVTGVIVFMVYQNALSYDDLVNSNIKKNFEQDDEYNKDLTRFNSMYHIDKDNYDYFVKKLSNSKYSKNTDLLNKIKLKYCKRIYLETQYLLKNTVELSKTVNVNHPIIQYNIYKVVENSNLIKSLIDQIKEIKDDDDFNFNYYYLRGNIYYIGLQVLADDQTKDEFFNQCLDSYKKAANIRMGHSEIVANIEILLKNEQSGNGPSNGDKVSKILIQAGASHLKGN